jgi:hypothetical protein
MTSTIKVDNINKVSDDSNIIKKCGSTTTVGSGSGQTIVVDGATVTLGRCGGTVNLASGATQTGFGRTGTVDWCTTAKTSPFTSESGKGYFVNTTGGSVTVTLPASPSGGDIVSIKDYADTFDTNSITIGRNGSKIASQCNDAVVTTEGASITMIYVDGTQGWLNIQTDSTVAASPFIQATGGTVTECGNFKIHTFEADGNFILTAGTDAPNNKVSYVVVAGGGGAGGGQGGGGGAGGFREGKCSADPYADSPLDAGTALTVTSQTYPITVGAGGSGAPNPAPGAGGASGGLPGSNSTFDSITSTGGGYGSASGAPQPNGGPGGSGGGGGGGASSNPGSATGGAGGSGIVVIKYKFQ